MISLFIAKIIESIVSFLSTERDFVLSEAVNSTRFTLLYFTLCQIQFELSQVLQSQGLNRFFLLRE